MQRKASALWVGPGKEGQGQLTTTSGVLKNTAYSFSTRFADGVGTNPEELIAAAHAGCFSMALAFGLSGAGFPPERIQTAATLTMEKLGAGWEIKTIHLHVNASVPKIDSPKFLELANDAKKNCPVSKLLRAEITMEARLM